MRGDGGDLRRFKRRFIGAFGLTIALAFVGTIGFSLFPGWTWSDAAYMTVVTLSSVGYGEVRPLGDGGRLFATVLLVGGVTSLGIWFALITATLVELDLAHTFRGRLTMKAITKLHDHVIVCGGGRMGRQVVLDLLKSRVPFVLIERDAACAEMVREEHADALIIEGDATQDAVLGAAGIERARGLVCALSADTDNLFVCLSARDLNPDLTIVSRAYDEESASKLQKAGANQVVSPNVTGGHRMSAVLLRPDVVSFLDVVTRGRDLELLLEQVPVPERSPLEGQSLEQAQIPRKTGLIVLAIKHGSDPKGHFNYNPGPAETINSGDMLIVLGRPEQIDALRGELA